MILSVQHTVRDYDAWKSVFDEHQSGRAKDGCLGHTIYRDADKPNDLTISLNHESRERADEFMRDPSLAEAMQRRRHLRPARHLAGRGGSRLVRGAPGRLTHAR